MYWISGKKEREIAVDIRVQTKVLTRVLNFSFHNDQKTMLVVAFMEQWLGFGPHHEELSTISIHKKVGAFDGLKKKEEVQLQIDLKSTWFV